MGIYNKKEYTFDELYTKILKDMKELIDKLTDMERTPMVINDLNKLLVISSYFTSKFNARPDNGDMFNDLGFDDLKHVAARVEGIYDNYGFTLPGEDPIR